MQNSYILTSFTDIILPCYLTNKSGSLLISAKKGNSPLDATRTVSTQAPANIPQAEDTYIVLKGSGSTAFAPLVAYSSGGTWKRAVVLAGEIMLLSVKYDAVGTDTITVNDGYAEIEVDVTTAVVTKVAGSFAITNSYNNDLQIKGDQHILVVGTGMNNVDSIADSDGNAIEFTVVDDENLVLVTSEFAATGSKTFTFYDSSLVSLGTLVKTFTDLDEIGGDHAFFTQRGDLVTLYLSDTADAVVAMNATTEVAPYATADDLLQYLNDKEQLWTQVVRDRQGVVISYADFTIRNLDNTEIMRDKADSDGVVQLSKYLLPDEFMFIINHNDVPVQEIYISLL